MIHRIFCKKQEELIYIFYLQLINIYFQK